MKSPIHFQTMDATSFLWTLHIYTLVAGLGMTILPPHPFFFLLLLQIFWKSVRCLLGSETYQNRRIEAGLGMERSSAVKFI